MKDRPILFSAPMVLGLLAGSKTQTRRIAKLPHQNPLGQWEALPWGGPNGGRLRDGSTVPATMVLGHSRTGDIIGCNHGQPGDRLWVRETSRAEELLDGLDGIRYQADGAFIKIMDDQSFALKWLALKTYGKNKKHDGQLTGPWIPSIHMTKWASRITLEITGIRVERLLDISEADAIAEGIERLPSGEWKDYGDPTDSCADPISSYRTLWESINGFQSSKDNPFIWVVEFKRITP